MKKNLATLMLIIFSAITITTAQKTVTVTGKVTNNDSKFEKIYLVNPATKVTLNESKIDKNGKFSLKTKISKTDFYIVKFDDKKYIVLILKPGEKVNLEIPVKFMHLTVIKGSKDSELYNEIIPKFQALKTKDEKHKFVKDLIDKHSNSLACLFFYTDLNMDDKEDMKYLKKLAKDLKKYSYISYVKSMINKINSHKNTGVGVDAPDIALKNPDGKIVKLSSFKGKYVLIDFWASWCRPCRGESPNMVKAYNKYHKKGFEIYSVSLDNGKAAWVKAIKDDGLGAWTHVSDLKGWRSAGGELYGVRSIPHTVLIGPKGKIIAKNLRGASLFNKLDKIFK